MTRKVRSARGQIVDFDLLKIKQQLADAPSPVQVDTRKEYVDNKEGIKKKPIIEEEANNLEEEIPEEVLAQAQEEPNDTDEFLISVTDDEPEPEPTAKKGSKNKASG